MEESAAWDRSEDHGRLLGPMRACFAQATRAAFEVRDGVVHRGGRIVRFTSSTRFGAPGKLRTTYSKEAEPCDRVTIVC